MSGGESKEDATSSAGEALTQLHGQLSGTMITPDDPLYDQARAVWNGMINLRPRAVVRADAVSDVDAVLRTARETGIPLAVRGGGHSIAGHSTIADGVVLDLGPLNRVTVDVHTRLVTVEPGATLADVDRETARHGLVIPFGVVSQTGVAGLTLGGGVGWLTRTAGLSLDNLTAVDLVTATGEHLHASEDENPELFWGIRGCGGNFGVVTSFTFRATPLPQGLVGANLFYRPENWRRALLAFERWSRDLPDEMNPIISILVLPPGLEMGSDPWLIVGCTWFGEDERAGMSLLDDLRGAVPPDEEEVGPVNWLTWQSAMDEVFPKGSRGYWKNLSFSRLDEEVADVLVDVASDITWFGTGIDIHLMGGAFARVPEDSTAFPNRSARFWLNIYGFWPDAAEDERLTAFARSAHAEMQPFADHGEYVNFLGAETGGGSAAATRRAYGEEKYRRLVALKNRYDPHNLFRLNHNIMPTTD